MAQDKILYVGDPMCSWCYGFSNELTAVVDEIGDSAEFEIIMGGLRPYNTQKMIELKGFLTEHWQHVNEASGMEFCYQILDSKTIVYDTEPASRALLWVKQKAPEKALLFFKKLQYSFYAENKDVTNKESLSILIHELGLDQDEFLKDFDTDALKQMVKAEFKRANELNARSFPTVFFIENDEIHIVSVGYDSAENILQKIKVLKKGR